MAEHGPAQPQLVSIYTLDIYPETTFCCMLSQTVFLINEQGLDEFHITNSILNRGRANPDAFYLLLRHRLIVQEMPFYGKMN